MPKNRLALFVHDLFLEIGHSNALIETIRHLPADKIDEIVVVAYTAGDITEYFKPLNCKIRWVKVPFANLYPFILKEVFYHIWTWVYAKLFLRSYYKIGVGIAALSVDLVDIQFIHQQWEKLYFMLLRPTGVAYFYKKFLFFYYKIIENYLFSQHNIKFLALSRFVYDYCLQKFNIASTHIRTIYSGINLAKFTPSPLTREELYHHLVTKFPTLQNIDVTKPIYLFVGAFERKGLGIILQQLEEVSDAQLIIIGKPESRGNFTLDNKITWSHIEFTQDLPLFYSLADCFLFASYYEPFGLVIIEAAAMGCQLIVTRDQVGAVELLEDLAGITIYNNDRDFKIHQVDILTKQQRQIFRRARLARLQQYSWHSTAQQLEKFIDL